MSIVVGPGGGVGAGGGGVLKVRELPTPERGLGNIYYVEETYQGPGPWLSADFDLTLTPAALGHPDNRGYNRAQTTLEGGIVPAGGAISPLPDGLEALVSEGGSLRVKLSGTLLARAGSRDLTVSFGGADYRLSPLAGHAGEWASPSPADMVAATDRWTVGTPVTVRVFFAGTETGLNYRGFARIGEKTKPPFGFYRQEDLQFVVTPRALRGDGSVFGYAEGALDVIVTQGGGMIDPLPLGVRGIYAGAGGAASLYTDDELAALLAASSAPVRLIFGGNSYTLPRFGSDNLWQTTGNPVPNSELWTDGTPVTVVIRQGDRALGADGFHGIGTEINPNRPEGGELVNRGFWHVDPDTMEWRRGFGGDAGGIPAVPFFEAGISDADLREKNWRGVLVGLAREDAGPEWRGRTRAGQEAVNAAQATASITSGGATLTVTLNAAAAEGAAGNAWTLRVVTGSLTSAGRAPGSTEIQITVGAGATFNNAVGVLNQRAGLDGNRWSAALTAGAGGTSFPQSLAGVQNFAGGLDAVPAAELGVEMDVGAKVIELEHLTGHGAGEIVEFLNGYEVDSDTTLYATLYGGSDAAASLEAAPQERPFSEAYSEGSLPRPTEDEIAALRTEIAGLTFADIGGMIGDGQVPATFTRDSEITRAFLLGILGLSAQELNDLFVGAVVSGSGAARVITVTQADGTTVTLAVPDTGDGGGGGSADGVITGATFSGDGSTITITRSVGANIVVNVPAALRRVPLSLTSIIAGTGVTIDRSTPGQITISASGAGAAIPTVRNRTTNYTLVAADLGNSVRLTGATARTFTLPAHGDTIPIGAIVYIINDATAALTIDGNGADTVDGAANLVIVPNEAVTLQKVGNNAWDLLSDTTSGEASVWENIPINTPIRLGQVVTHGGAFFGAITAHNRSSTGPDGDAVNWVQISNWRGDWQNVWYPVGSFVRDAGLPFVAVTAVVRGDPRPTAANNVKWLLLGENPSNVVIASSNTVIPATADHDTYIHTGSANITYTLPPASGGNAVDDGWEIVFTNQGAGDLTIAANGADTINSSSDDIVLSIRETIRVQKVANGAWIIIADTRDDTGAAENLPTVVNVSANTAIPATAHGDTYRVTGAAARTITLPDPDDVPLGFFVRIANGSPDGTDHRVARQGAGQTIEGGNGPLTVPAGEVVSLQKINANEWEIITDTGKAAAMAGMASGDSRAVPIHAANVALANTNYVDAGFDWPETIPYLLVQWNPNGRRNHSSFAVIYNPRLGRFPGDVTGVTNAAVGDAPSAANSIGYAVPFAISAGREIEAAQASFGKTAANRALIACSDATQDPTPLVVLAIVPADRAGTARSTVIQAPVPGADGAGVSSITLPADYATYKTLSLVMWDHSGDRINSSDFPTALLAAQTAEVHLALGFVADIDWNPATRQLDHTEDRILYAELHDGGASAGLDQDARDAAAAARGVADAARDAAVASQLDTDTVIVAGPELVRGDVTPRNLNVSIRHPINAYPEANQWFMRIAGSVLARLSYDSTELQQDVDAGLSAAVLQNIWDQTVEIDDGMGGTTRVPRYPVGSYVPVEVRLDGPAAQGVGRVTHFIRIVDVLVVAAPVSRRFETTVGASPAVLPVGTYEIHIKGKPESTPEEVVKLTILVSEFESTDEVFEVRGRGPDHIQFTARYVAATRQLTYSVPTSGGGERGQGTVEITAVGES